MDEPRGARKRADDGNVSSPSLLDRVRYRVRSAIETISFGERCFEWFDRRGRDKPQSKIHTDGFADDVVAPPECPSISDLPTRSRPFTYPTRNHTESNTVDLIAIESSDRLTVTHPDNSEAKISSDMWEAVEQ
ncbi:hypothetical protein ACODNH_16030 [Haloarcula sp. NS06]|uniref:hypothetical protein n=1 Tax=unclassified Haloarcula TaxID=2624677 RepID=UPI0027B7C687|nr:hypothetical protein [Haloarcula sp. H-GB4]MDQ2071780.1 hypothetical protein [Haloarcula sp. H-GB4]